MASLVKDDETFVTLIQVAQADPVTGKCLAAILSLGKTQRHSLINSLIEELTLKNGPRDFIAALSCLLSDDVAERALAAIREELEDEDIFEHPKWYILLRIPLVFAGVAAGVLTAVYLAVIPLEKNFNLSSRFSWFLPVVASFVVIVGIVGGLIVESVLGRVIAARLRTNVSSILGCPRLPGGSNL